MINPEAGLNVTTEWSSTFKQQDCKSGLINGTGTKGMFFDLQKNASELIVAQVCLQPAGTSFNCFPIWKAPGMQRASLRTFAWIIKLKLAYSIPVTCFYSLLTFSLYLLRQFAQLIKLLSVAFVPIVGSKSIEKNGWSNSNRRIAEQCVTVYCAVEEYVVTNIKKQMLMWFDRVGTMMKKH